MSTKVSLLPGYKTALAKALAKARSLSAQYKGDIFSNAGDALEITFEAPHNAMNTALEFQSNYFSFIKPKHKTDCFLTCRNGLQTIASGTMICMKSYKTMISMKKSLKKSWSRKKTRQQSTTKLRWRRTTSSNCGGSGSGSFCIGLPSSLPLPLTRGQHALLLTARSIRKSSFLRSNSFVCLINFFILLH